MGSKRKASLALACATLMIGTACGKKPDPPSGAASAPAGGASAVAAGELGVPACDTFMKKYVACIESKVPAAERESFRQSLEGMKGLWKQMAATPEGRSALVTACTQAEAASKQAMTSYGCQW